MFSVCSSVFSEGVRVRVNGNDKGLRELGMRICMVEALT